jgi:hypothetical protein
MTTPPSPPATPPTLWDTAFEPYALEIGFLLREWNNLQDRLRSLFATLLRIPNTDIAYSIWYAIPNDRHQRQMIRNLASYLFNPKDTFFPHDDRSQLKTTAYEEKLWQEISWIITSADELGPRRDAAAHSPVAFIVGDPGEFVAKDIFGNPQAKTLKGKKLLNEFRLCRDRASILQKHAEAIQHVVEMNSRNLQLQALPERPPWPSNPQKKKDADPSRKGRAKAQTHPPRSSQA